ncbi:MAG: hypothetical protein SF066_12215 [Thermoanaerobaculia bacterium]|nr:hypothetical protein [Thermoanaerobaculia bacterium]
MRTLTSTTGILLALLLAARPSAQEPQVPVPPADPAEGIQWPVPEGWGQESIPFPLSFAPQLTYRGFEELRFAPGWSKPTEPGYWSYVIVWWLTEKPALDAATLENALTTYFLVLSEAVGGDEDRFESSQFRAELVADGSAGLTGRIFSIDAFTTGLPITLNVVIESRECVKAKRHAVTLLLSPRAKTEPIWRDLESAARALVCE